MTEYALAVSVCFTVEVDNLDLGVFTSVEGLGCQIEMKPVTEGGNNEFVWQLPTRMTYNKVKLSRPLGPDTTKIAQWFAKLATGIVPTTARIAARDIALPGDLGALTELPIIAQWELLHVVPVSWTGPSLGVDSAKVCMETIEIAHHGFGRG